MVEPKVESARCMDCGVPFCQSTHGCPVENLIPDWNHAVREDNWEKALLLLHSTNNFPEFTGRLCPAPCESACVLGISDRSVSIRAIESKIIERGFEKGWVKPVLAGSKTGKRVAIVGSGPAGLASAQQLVRLGHEVTVFEKSDRLGGLLRYGIPDFKMEKKFLDRRLDQLVMEGVEFRTNTHLGVSYEVEQLPESYDVICLTMGAEKPRDLEVPGRELDGIHFAMDYLTQQNRRNLGDAIPEDQWITAQGKRVVVVGGGDTGSDCIGTAHRQGCLEVHQLELLPQPPIERHSSTPWPLLPLQLRTSPSQAKGCDRQWNIMTTGFTGAAGRVTHLHGKKTSGSSASDFEMSAELVLLAIGFKGLSQPQLMEKMKIRLDPSGRICTDLTYMTNRPGIFAAGDARRGPSLIVWAIAEGRKMATSVDQFLRNGKSTLLE